MATLEDVAALAGVSRATVSRVVNGDKKVKAATCERVQAAIATLDYSPHPMARALAARRSKMIGLVTTSYIGGFFGALMDGVQDEVEHYDNQLLVTQGKGSAENEWEAIQSLFRLRCDGAILHVRELSDEQLCQLAEQGHRFILLDRLVPGLESRCVCFDHYQANRLAVESLLACNHRNIACISGPLSRSSARLRLQGFSDAMQDAGLIPVACGEGDYGLQGGYLQASRILSTSRPSALYCCSEDMALGALLAIAEHHLSIPQDISVLCYDSGERAAFLSPALSSIHFPIIDMARYAARLLLDENAPLQTFSPQLIERHSLSQPGR